MNIEKEKPQLNKNDILAAFGDRILIDKKEKPKRKYLDIDENLTTQSLVPYDVAEQFEAITMEDCLPDAPNAKIIHGCKPLFVKNLKEGPNPIALVFSKVMFRANEAANVNSEFIINIIEGDLIGKTDQEIIGMVGDSNNEIGSIRLCKAPNNTFEMMHRFVREEYRGPQGNNGLRISNILLNISEQIVQNFASTKQKESSLKINSGQLNVMTWLYNNNYKIRGAKGEENFKRIINADEGLRVIDGLYVFESDKIPNKDEIYNKRHDDIRVSFERKFSPEHKNGSDAGLESDEAKQRLNEGQKISNIRDKLTPLP